MRSGGVVSCTVIVKVSVAVLPALSVAVHVTVVIPSGKVLPDGRLQVGVMGPSTASLAVAVYVTTASSSARSFCCNVIWYL